MADNAIAQELANETMGNGHAENPIGVYKHEEAGASLVATNLPQADAYTRLGYKFDRELKDSDLTPQLYQEAIERSAPEVSGSVEDLEDNKKDTGPLPKTAGQKEREEQGDHTGQPEEPATGSLEERANEGRQAEPTDARKARNSRNK